jgi:hypothetical protein
MSLRTQLLLAAMTALAVPLAAHAQPPAAAAAAARTPLAERAQDVIAIINGDGDPAALFTPAFLAQVPPEQLRAISAQIVQQYGRAVRVAGLAPRDDNSGTLDIATERGTLHIRIGIEAAPPHRIANLLVTGADLNGDTIEAVLAEIRALPGATGVALARLGDEGPRTIASAAPDRPLAIGSTFKLFVLAELDRQVRAGERQWTDVVRLGARSAPSGIMQNWPADAPVTLHTLATLMISISDNTATDTLLRIVGRENVERMMATIGVSTAARNRPFLSTMELFSLKAAPEPAFAAWRDADEAGRRAILARDYAEPDPARLPPTLFADGPARIDSVEWFVTPDDLVRTMDWLRRNTSDTARAILAVNPGNAALRGDFAYVGFKGGSEPGVINLTWLLQGRDGAWYTATGSWNNPDAVVDEQRFLTLMTRAVTQLARGS